MTISRSALAALATSALVAGLGAGSASAQQIVPVPSSAFKPVAADVQIRDAGGAVVGSHSCEWTEPQADDRPCLKFVGDPKAAIDRIEEAGGATATVHVTSEGLDKLTRISRRGDGTWLLRTRGVSGPQTLDFGFVCSASGDECTRWDSAKAESARAAVKAAAARLRR